MLIVLGITVAAGLSWLLLRDQAPRPVVVDAGPPLDLPQVLAPPPPAPPPTPPATAEAKAPPVAVRMLAGKPVVLEDEPLGDGPNAAIVAKARAACRRGDARLAARDRKAAIKAYRAALKLYPAYIGAYRGLGRALAIAGDKAAAIKVLSVYVVTVPEAKDVTAINQLIEKLKKKPARRK